MVEEEVEEEIEEEIEEEVEEAGVANKVERHLLGFPCARTIEFELSGERNMHVED